MALLCPGSAGASGKLHSARDERVLLLSGHPEDQSLRPQLASPQTTHSRASG